MDGGSLPPAGAPQSLPDLVERHAAVAAHVVTQDADELPALGADRVPAVGVLRELARIFRVYTPVVLDADTPTPIREVEFGDMPTVRVMERPVDVGFREAASLEQQPQPRLSWRAGAGAHISQRGGEAASHVAHRVDLVPQLSRARERTRSRDEELRRADEVVDPPRGGSLAPCACRVLDRESCVLARRRFAVLKTVTYDAADARLSRGPVGVDMDPGGMRPFGNGNSVERERRLTSEELPRP